MWRLPCNFYNVIIVQMKHNRFMVKFMYSEKAIKFCEISTLLLSYVVLVKSKVKILQNFVAYSEYMNFMKSQGWLVIWETLYICTKNNYLWNLRLFFVLPAYSLVHYSSFKTEHIDLWQRTEGQQKRLWLNNRIRPVWGFPISLKKLFIPLTFNSTAI